MNFSVILLAFELKSYGTEEHLFRLHVHTIFILLPDDETQKSFISFMMMMIHDTQALVSVSSSLSHTRIPLDAERGENENLYFYEFNEF